jgi:hydroxyethylthiazole kinase-like uncharacterized protein yjeF
MSTARSLLYSTAAARRIDRDASADLGGDGYVLMNRAGQAAWRCLLQRWPRARRLLVACGSGNNGGDGYVLARLALASGLQVQVVHAPGSGPRSELGRRAHADFIQAGGVVEVCEGALAAADVVVDAVLGIGLEQAPREPVAGLLRALNRMQAPILALDVPSGVDAGRGQVPGDAVRAACTLQFIVPHLGLYTGAALDQVGELCLDRLGIDPDRYAAQAPAAAELLDDAALGRWLHARRRDTHKGQSGRVLCVGGDHGGGGAIALCAEAALRCGAGLVRVGTRPGHVGPILARRPEAMVRAVESDDQLQPLMAQRSVIACGPGLGQEAWGRHLHAQVLRSGMELVLDADALNLLEPEQALAPDTVLTPHPGEAARLLGTGIDQVQADRMAAAAGLAARHGCVVVLKGAGTIIAAPGLMPAVLDAGNPGMATGGMGDLLTGTIASLRAQGLAAFDAACAGALIHSLAGDAAAREGGQRGLLPSDLLPWLRRLVNTENPDAL